MSSIGLEFPQALAAAQEGAEWAWTALYNSLAPQVAGYARAKGAPEPDDVVGEVFHDLARNIGGFRGDEANFRSWAFQVAHNRLIDQWRRDSRRLRGRPADERLAVSAEAEALRSSTDGAAFAALDSLTEAQRNVILLRTIGDLSLEQVADVLGTNRNAVKALQHRAVRRLQKILGQAVTK